MRAKTAWISDSVSNVLVVAGQGHRQGLPSAVSDVISATDPGQSLCCQISSVRLSLLSPVQKAWWWCDARKNSVYLVCLCAVRVCRPYSSLWALLDLTNGAVKWGEWRVGGARCKVWSVPRNNISGSHSIEKQMNYAIKFYDNVFAACDICTFVKTISLEIMTRILLTFVYFFRVDW